MPLKVFSSTCGHSQGVGSLTGSVPCFFVVFLASRGFVPSPSASLAGRRHALNALALEVLLRFLRGIVVRSSVTGVHVSGDLLEVDFSRAYLLWEPQLCLSFPHPRRAKLPSTAEESPLIFSATFSSSSLQNTKFSRISQPIFSAAMSSDSALERATGAVSSGASSAMRAE